MNSETLLEITNLTCSFRTAEGVARAVDDVSFSVMRGETLGVVGESGCGKTVTALAILRLIPSPPGKIDAGKIVYKGTDLLALPEREMRKIRGNEISMIFQEPMTSLNPVFTCGYQIDEAVILHQKVGKREARERTIEMLHLVGIPDPPTCANSYPHQLSGGMRQRVMIAMALACEPELLIADEPTTALDVTIQAQILALLRELQQERGLAMLFITHDLAVVAQIADAVCVMYAGRIVEQAPAAELFGQPRHPYTQALLRSTPRVAQSVVGQRLPVIPGEVPRAGQRPPGCAFHPRCEWSQGD